MSKINNRSHGFLQTGQHRCYDAEGREIPCEGTGQDAEFGSGIIWPQPRFVIQNDVVLDQLTELAWLKNANLSGFPLNWQEALALIAEMNARTESGFSDWRLPNRRELRSLICHQTRRPALPEDHPFNNVFASWYWSSTTVADNPDHAWYINLDGGRMFYGGKDQSYMVWPVRGAGSSVIPRSGQQLCYDPVGTRLNCEASRQDGEYQYGLPWPEPRFESRPHVVLDRLTGLLWSHTADLADGAVSWDEALAAISRLNKDNSEIRWRLPNINELESLIDCAAYRPALPAQHPFRDVRDIYWSSTTSFYQADWAWALYMDKGAVGVGQKVFARFYLWAVADKAPTKP